MNSIFLFAAVAMSLHVVYSIPTGHQGQHGSALGDIMKVNKYAGQELFEGDIKNGSDSSEIANGLSKNKGLRWTGKVLHFTINGFNEAQRSVIRDAAREIEKNTCIKMKEYPYGSAPGTHIEVFPGSGCWSYIGQRGGRQQLSLQSNGCVYKGTAMHEFLHALGVYHEQSRADRDDYINVHWENIQSGLEHNFNKAQTDSMGVEYDPKSVMQYPDWAFSKNGKATLSWKKDPSLELGGEQLTASDIEQLNLFYECDGPVTTKEPTTKPKTTKPKTTKPKTTKSKTTKPKTTKPKTTKPKTTKPKTTKPKTTKSKTTKPKTTKPKTTKPKTTKPKTTKPKTVCGDTRFECVYAYYSRFFCRKTWRGINFKVDCPQTCRQCDGGYSIQCGNFKDDKYFGCHEKVLEGRCTTRNFKVRYEMKNKCTRSCCDIGRIYY